MTVHDLRYPVDHVVPDLLRAFENSNIAVLSAPPGAGKTTRVPIAIMRSGLLNDQRLLMFEPRRLAAIRSAEFMAAQQGERTGESIGYRIRGDSKTGPRTRIEVLTEGILTRMLHQQADMPGVGMIIFDEFHERSIHADLGLALTLDVQQHLRNNLLILIMSATLEGTRLSTLLRNASTVECKGKRFSVETHFASYKSEKPIDQRIAERIQRVISLEEGDVLVFLPGWREIQRTEQSLQKLRLPEEVVIHTLHGEASPESQTAALAPSPQGKRKVILSTNVAETSITIEGVRIVVDSGLMRISRFDPRRGMSGLVTIPISRASADQRRGRAGRLGSGSCYRMWTEAEHQQLAEFNSPEIVSADLAPMALDLFRWGTPNGESLRFLDPPPVAHLKQAHALLRDLEAVDSNGQLTSLGRRMSELPVHPRLAHMILRASEIELGAMACSLAALLEERDLLAGQRDVDVDLAIRWQELSSGRGALRERVKMQARRLREMIGAIETNADESHLGLLLAFAYPERVAQRRTKGGLAYMMASGTTALLPPGSHLAREEFITIADAETVGSDVRVFLAAPLAKQRMLEVFKDRLILEEEIRWDSAAQSVVARRVTRLGALVLAEQAISGDDDRISETMAAGVREIGIDALTWDNESSALCGRSEWLRKRRLVGEDWPDLSRQHLTDTLNQWLVPFLRGVRQRSHLSRLNLSRTLHSLFTSDQMREMNRLAPSHLKVPSGSLIALDYSSGDQPVLGVRLQELFGQSETPRVGGDRIPVVIHLLSPAKRPLAVTQDLPSFWRNTYPEIRKQLRAKYPKHIWPDDPLTAQPTNKTKRHLTKQG
jgi:ATP-dependent helicase HrpB